MKDTSHIEWEIDWQLYSDKGSKRVNAQITNKFWRLVQKAKNKKYSLDEIMDGGALKIAEGIRDEMYKYMNNYDSYGARDTEPGVVLVTELEKVFKLNEYELER